MRVLIVSHLTSCQVVVSSQLQGILWASQQTQKICGCQCQGKYITPFPCPYQVVGSHGPQWIYLLQPWLIICWTRMYSHIWEWLSWRWRSLWLWPVVRGNMSFFLRHRRFVVHHRNKATTIFMPLLSILITMVQNECLSSQFILRFTTAVERLLFLLVWYLTPFTCPCKSLTAIKPLWTDLIQPQLPTYCGSSNHTGYQVIICNQLPGVFWATWWV